MGVNLASPGNYVNTYVLTLALRQGQVLRGAPVPVIAGIRYTVQTAHGARPDPNSQFFEAFPWHHSSYT
jgi:hypothetical protein